MEQIPLVISLIAVFISILALYFAHFFKSTKALLCLVTQEEPDNRRKLTYTLSNTGNQELFIKHVHMLLKPTNKIVSQVPMCNIQIIEPFIIKPNEIKYFTIIEDNFKNQIDKNMLKIVNIQMISSLGKKFELNHNITHLKNDTKLKDNIYNCVELQKFIL